MNKESQILEIIIGLPGSGKTTYLKRRLAEGAIDSYFDDYQKGAPEEDKSNPRTSPNYLDLKADIEQGKNVAIADIRYCLASEEVLVAQVMQTEFPQVAIVRTYFANDPEACRHNILHRNREEWVETELQFIEAHSPEYKPPKNQTIPVIMG